MMELGTDDTGIFMTNICNEYTHAPYCIEAKVGRQKAEQLLNRLVGCFEFEGYT